MRELRLFVLIVAASVLLGACGGSVPLVGYPLDAPQIPVKSYSFLNRDALRAFNPLGNDLTNNRIELAVEKSFSSRGYQYVSEQKNADILVSYFVLGTDKQYLIDYNRGVKPCAQCPMSETRKQGVIKYERGAVIVDFLNPDTLRSIWRGSLKKMIKAEQSPSERNESIKKSIGEIVALYPPSK